MEILHVCAECYPVAKAGGLGDVTGALPVYLNRAGHIAKVVMPMHRTPFLYENEWEVVHKGHIKLYTDTEFTVIKEKNNRLGFDLYCIDINGLLDREKIYGYDDDTMRFIAFQVAVCEWLSKWNHKPDVVHVHDHHAGLIPFFLKFVLAYGHLSNIRTVLTVHNAQYQGIMGWDAAQLFPAWDSWKWGMLEWDDNINSLAAAVKCADHITTVSPGYLQELMHNANGLESLFRNEAFKCTGIINGIDIGIWNPGTDTFILDNYSVTDVGQGKDLNKKKICKDMGLNKALPLFIFIGRLVKDKGADLLPGALDMAFHKFGKTFSVAILGSGMPALENALLSLNDMYPGFCHTTIAFNEKLSHQLYAGADFLLMPSRVEPCGLNQLYSMRYGTIPVVRETGGLADTVIDVGNDGFGITFKQASEQDICNAIGRARELFSSQAGFTRLRKTVMEIDHSWEESVQKYISIYNH